MGCYPSSASRRPVFSHLYLWGTRKAKNKPRVPTVRSSRWQRVYLAAWRGATRLCRRGLARPARHVGSEQHTRSTLEVRTQVGMLLESSSALAAPPPHRGLAVSPHHPSLPCALVSSYASKTEEGRATNISAPRVAANQPVQPSVQSSLIVTLCSALLAAFPSSADRHPWPGSRGPKPVDRRHGISQSRAVASIYYTSILTQVPT